MFRRAVQILTIGYLGVLLVLLTALEWWAEKNWMLSLLLFAPGWILLLPLAVLTPLALIRWQWRLLLVQLGCVVFVLFGYMTFRWNSRPTSGPDDLKIITHNAEQGNPSQFTAFLQKENPDVVLLQDAAVRGLRYPKLFPGYSTAVLGEYICISRYPIAKADFVPGVVWEGRPLAARFELEIRGRAVAVYNVHMVTPRPHLNRFLNRTLIRQATVNRSWPAGADEYRRWLPDQISRAESLSARLSEEKQTFIVAGDLNTPDHGYIYHLFSGRMTDAFMSAGRGWGMTFPGGRDGEKVRSGPWLRLDYVFAGRGWAPVFCEPEHGTRSQHRAVLAILRPSSSL